LTIQLGDGAQIYAEDVIYLGIIEDFCYSIALAGSTSMLKQA
jgi:hypothetical protein